jgi:hypothetical protein
VPPRHETNPSADSDATVRVVLIGPSATGVDTVRMAKKQKLAGKKVQRAMHEMKAGTLRSGRSGKKVTNPKQALAIGLSEARQAGARVPAKKRKRA